MLFSVRRYGPNRRSANPRPTILIRLGTKFRVPSINTRTGCACYFARSLRSLNPPQAFTSVVTGCPRYQSSQLRPNFLKSGTVSHGNVRRGEEH
jgi:hypothetical protein